MRKNIRYILFLLAFISFGKISQSQVLQYGNEWINFSQTYYKFKIGKNGVYRMPYSLLQSYGMGTVPGSNFAIYRDGKQIPIYVSTSGILGAADYIEFYAYKADGKMDTEMYSNPYEQPNDDINIVSDTAYYFITYGTGANLRLQMSTNIMPPNPPAAEAFCFAKAYPTTSFRTTFSNGASIPNGSLYYFSAKHERGEGYGISANGVVSLTVPTPEVYAASGQPAVLGISNFWNNANSGTFSLTLNSTPIFDSAMGYFYNIKRNIAVAPSSLSNNNQINFNSNPAYNIFAQNATITYPRTFNFNNVAQLYFTVPGNNATQIINLANVNSNQNIVVDLTNKIVYHVNNSGGNVQCVLSPSTQNRELFFSQTAENISSLKPVTFKNYNLSANQGDYLILSDRDLINIPNSGVQSIKNYRASIAGGAYNAQVIEANELYDQFGYGVEYHPLSIKKFLKYANDTWQIKPQYMFIVGKGLSYPYLQNYISNKNNYFPIVPTYGIPGSDNLFGELGNNSVPYLAIGRISAYNNNEVITYLNKLTAYEAAIKTPIVPNLENTLWKKKVLHIAGSQDSNLQATLYGSLNYCKTIIEDTLTGAMVTTTGKTSTDVIENANAAIDSLINNGVQYVNFFGHASSSGFDYNLNTPENFNSLPKLPIFMAYGCDIADIYNLTATKTIAEKYISVPNGGSIAMIAGDNYGWTSQLAQFMQNLYRNFAYQQYGKTLGEQNRANLATLMSLNPNDIFMATHVQNLLLQGDPALRAYSPDKPDYYIDETLVSNTPSIINTSLDSFEIAATVYNLGKAIKDSFYVHLTHTKMGSATVLFSDSVKISVLNSRKVKFKIPVNALTDIGLNSYTITVNKAGNPDEITFQNNNVTLQLFIAENNLMPIYPYNFSIVYNQNLTLKASTLNPFLKSSRFLMEIDTTELFNSPFKKDKTVVSSGGVIKWNIPFSMTDSTVYYWRTTVDTMVNGKRLWNNSSFIYLANGSDGWNQSHYYQYEKDRFNSLVITDSNRNFRYGTRNNNLRILNKIVNWSAVGCSNYLNNINLGNGGCEFGGGIQMILINPATGTAIKNVGQYTGTTPICNGRVYHFEFSTTTPQSRKNAMDFFANIPNGYYVMVKSFIYDPWFNNKFINDWKADTAVYGSGNSLYHTLINMGFSQINQFTEKKSFIFFGRKGDPSYIPQQVVGTAPYDELTLETNFNTFGSIGSMTSTIIGPATEWKQLLWQTKAHDNLPEYDSNFVKIYGLTSTDNSIGTLLATTNNRDTLLTQINAQQYPKLRLEWYAKDSTMLTPSNLKYWRVLFKPLPEAALNPLAALTFKDTVQEGENITLKLGIENLTKLPMDSMLVRYKILDANNVIHPLATKRYKPLAGEDTLVADLSFNPSNYTGKNVIFIEANPDNDQPEQYHPNNLGYLSFYVNPDKFSPVMDVTFDGVHILDKDIVSAKPFIKVLLRDENKYNLLNDTSLLKLTLVYPDQSSVNIPFDGNICRFVPASNNANGKNEARVEFRPTLQDGIYRLQVTAKDKSGNVVGNTNKNYEVSFMVENKSTITNVLNYPNPFSTSTQFVFTLTGSEIPSQFKIQIISVTGKVVKEITKAELGPLHIGRNITEYRWDGRDQFGQMLGNGVYLYRVITNNNKGEAIELKKSSNIDKYFKNGYGKLYIMR